MKWIIAAEALGAVASAGWALRVYCSAVTGDRVAAIIPAGIGLLFALAIVVTKTLAG